MTERYAGNVDRIGDVFANIPDASRPAAASPTALEVVGEPVPFLLMGTDTRASTLEGEAPGGRSDAIMIARVARTVSGHRSSRSPATPGWRSPATQ